MGIINKKRIDPIIDQVYRVLKISQNTVDSPYQGILAENIFDDNKHPLHLNPDGTIIPVVVGWDCRMLPLVDTNYLLFPNAFNT